jgi:hypothetical protein
LASFTRAARSWACATEPGLLLLRRRGDLLAERVLLGAQGLVLGDRGAAHGIGLDGVVDEGG